jgi:hypothetical protein
MRLLYTADWARLDKFQVGDCYYLVSQYTSLPIERMGKRRYVMPSTSASSALGGGIGDLHASVSEDMYSEYVHVHQTGSEARS